MVAISNSNLSCSDYRNSDSATISVQLQSLQYGLTINLIEINAT